MPRLALDQNPSYRLHKASGQAVVTIAGKDIYLGLYDSPKSRAAYDRVIAEWRAKGRGSITPSAQTPVITVGELILQFWSHVEQHYRHPDGRPTSEVEGYRSSLRPLRKIYEALPAADFGPLALKAVREWMVEAGLSRGVVSPVTYDRKNLGGRPLIAPHPHLSIVGGIQPALLTDMRPRDNGFMDRFLFAFPDPTPAPGYINFEAPQTHLDRWASIVRSLGGAHQSNDDTGREVEFTTCGLHAWAEFLDGHAAEVNDPSFPDHLQGPWSKLRGYAGRLALILHLLRRAAGEEVGDDVDEDSVRRAVRVVDYFKSHARKAHAALATDPRVRGAKKIVDWVRQSGLAEFSRRDAHRALEGTFHRATDIDPAIELLVDKG
jgi:hypothetical protein